MVVTPAWSQLFFTQPSGRFDPGSRYDRPNYERYRYDRRDGYWRRDWRVPRYRAAPRYYDDRGDYARNPYDDPEPQRRAAPTPSVHVDSPEYYTYKPDALKTVSLSDLATVSTALNGAADATLESTSFASARTYLASYSIRVLPEVGEAIKGYYAKNPHFIWVRDRAVTDKARAAMAELAHADRYGLSPADYRVTVPATAEFGRTEDRMAQLVRFEMDLSAAVLTYVLDATRGRIAPDRISGYHDFDRKSVDLVGALGQIAGSSDVAASIRSHQPQSRPFQALVAALQKLRQTPSTVAYAQLDDGMVLQPGETSPKLSVILAAIRAAGSDKLVQDHAAVFAGTPVKYDDQVVAVVRDFQKEAGLSVDGIVGPNTVAALKRTDPAQRISKIKLAMERLRWLPRTLGSRYVLINEPAFRVTYVRDGAAPLSMRAIVGKKSRQTYFFADKIEAVEYNPYWNVPRSIVVNEMLAHLYRDPSYLDRHGYEVINTAGRHVSSASVDWSAYARKKISVDVRQRPGNSNALGRVKISFPNRHAIYMHDTPQKHLFTRETRDFSHGCVRLRRPREMAAALLDTSVSHVNSRIATGKNAKEPVAGDIPVYVAYFTAWPAQDGTIRYFNDIYDRDSHLSQAMKRTEAVRHVS